MEGGGLLTITITITLPRMTERAPSARVKLQYISEAFKKGVGGLARPRLSENEHSAGTEQVRRCV